MRRIKDLRPNPANPRKITDPKLKALKKSLLEFGDLSGFVWNQTTGQLVGGHQRGKVLPEESIINIDRSYEPPTRTGTVAEGYIEIDNERFTYREVRWDPTREKAANLAANKHGGEFEMKLLAEFLIDLDSQNYDLELTGFDEKEIEDICAPFRTMPGDETEDEIPEVEETKVRLGDLWELGEHRVLCGDSTIKENIERLMNGEKADMVFTDPPYGLNFNEMTSDKGSSYLRHGHKKDIIGNESVDTAVKAIELIKGLDLPFIIWGANHFSHALPGSRGWIVWDKQVLDKSVCFSDCEIAYSSFEKPARIFRHVWDGFRKGSEHGEARQHISQKPIALAEWCLENYGTSSTVLDLFLGSGSTLIACEKTNRRCFGLEIDSHYCDVIIQRWEKYSGKKAKRSDGKLYSEI